MLQRRQTLYLLGALILTICLFFIDLGNVTATDAQGLTYLCSLRLRGFYMEEQLVQAEHGIFWGAIGVILINLIAIFYYRNRVAQMRFCIYAMALTLCLAALCVLSLHSIENAENIHYGYALSFFPVCFILQLLAFLGIKSDKAKVDSYERIR